MTWVNRFCRGFFAQSHTMSEAYRPMSHQLKIFFGASLITASVAAPAQASCGLDVCPVPKHPDEQQPTIEPLIGFRHTMVDDDAHYSETQMGALFQTTEWLQLGINIPLLTTMVFGERNMGLGNIVPFVSAEVFSTETNLVTHFGIQLETPTASSPVLGDSHFLILPTIQTGWYPEKIHLLATAGWGYTLNGKHAHGSDALSEDHDHHGHDHAEHHSPQTGDLASIVNPHTNSELLFRLDAGHGWDVKARTFQLGLRTDFIQSLDQNATDQPIVNMGPTIALLQRSLAADLFFLAPLGESDRFRSRLGFRFRTKLP